MSTEHEPRRPVTDMDLDSQFPESANARPGPLDVSDYPDSHVHEYVGEEGRRGVVSQDALLGDESPRRGPVIPASAPRPQDHLPPQDDALDNTPVMNEALGILVVPFEYDGMRLEVPADPEDWPVEATHAFEKGKVVTAVENLLSASDFQKVMAKKYRNRQFGDLFNALAKAGGFADSGN